MATYNPDWKKCVLTLDSIIGQKDIDLELIVVDDGSSNNLFQNFESYLKDKGFENYKLIAHENNQGTVKNYYDGVSNASGKFVKLISPGDALYNEKTLSDWVKVLKESGKCWSFAEAAYYSYIDDKTQIIKCPVAPRVIDCYLLDNSDECRWNYIVLEDLPLGAAILCDRIIFSDYLHRIADKVIYSEDLSFMLMMYNNIIPFYYPENTMIYEFGCGVSTTSDNKWRIRFHNDLKNVEMILIDEPCNDPLQLKISHVLAYMNSGSDLRKRLSKNMQKGGLKKVIKYRLCPRMSSVDCHNIGNWWNEFM